MAPTFIEIDQADGIAKRNPAFDSVDIDAGTFGGNPPTPDDSSTSSELRRISGRAEIVQSLRHRRPGEADLHVAAGDRVAMAGEIKIEAPSTDKDADVTVHQGALDYLNDNQQSFFDKYGDEIFYGMLIFPVFGSAIAGVASYLRSRQPHAPAAAAAACARSGPQGPRRANAGGDRPAAGRGRQPGDRDHPPASTKNSTRRCGCRSRSRSIRFASPSPRAAPRSSTMSKAAPKRPRAPAPRTPRPRPLRASIRKKSVLGLDRARETGVPRQTHAPLKHLTEPGTIAEQPPQQSHPVVA